MVSQTVHWLLLLAKTKFKSRLLKVIILLGGLLGRKVGTLETFPLMKYYRFDTDIEAKHWKTRLWYPGPWPNLPQSSLCSALCCPAWWRFLASSDPSRTTYILILSPVLSKKQSLLFCCCPSSSSFCLNTITAGQWGVNLFQRPFQEAVEEVWKMRFLNLAILSRNAV